MIAPLTEGIKHVKQADVLGLVASMIGHAAHTRNRFPALGAHAVRNAEGIAHKPVANDAVVTGIILRLPRLIELAIGVLDRGEKRTDAYVFGDKFICLLGGSIRKSIDGTPAGKTQFFL